MWRQELVFLDIWYVFKNSGSLMVLVFQYVIAHLKKIIIIYYIIPLNGASIVKYKSIWNIYIRKKIENSNEYKVFAAQRIAHYSWNV